MIALVLLLAVQAVTGPVRAPQVTARITPDSVGVGEPIIVELRVRAPIGSEVRFPALPDSSDVVEPLDPRLVRDVSNALIVDRTAVYRLIAWDTGRRVLKFADITVAKDGAERRYSVTLPPLRIRSVLPADTTRRQPRNARDLLAIASGLWRLWLALTVIIGLLYLGWRAWRQRSARRVALGPDAAALARDAFAHAARLGLLEAGEAGRYALTHVGVMRSYLAVRYTEAAPSRTAREVVDALGGTDFPVLPERVGELLLRCEPIAFAQAPVSADEARGIAAEARAIVGEVETAWRARVESRTRVRRRPP